MAQWPIQSKKQGNKKRVGEGADSTKFESDGVGNMGEGLRKIGV